MHATAVLSFERQRDAPSPCERQGNTTTGKHRFTISLT